MCCFAHFLKWGGHKNGTSSRVLMAPWGPPKACRQYLRPQGESPLHWPSKPDILGAQFPLQEPKVRLRFLAPWEELLQLWLSSPLWVACLGMWILTLPHLCCSCLSCCGYFFISLAVEDLFWYISVFSNNDGCFISLFMKNLPSITKSIDIPQNHFNSIFSTFFFSYSFLVSM